MKVLKIIHTPGHGGAENTFRWLAWGLRNKGIDVVAAVPQSNHAHEENWTASALTALDVPYVTFDVTGSPWQLVKNIVAVIDRTRPDIVHSHLLDSNFYSSLACRLSSLPHVSTEHGDISLKHTIRSRLKYALMSICSQSIICVSDAVKESVSRSTHLPRKLKTVYNGIHFMESCTSTFRTEFKIPKNALLIGTVGNLYPVKGQKHLVMAFAELLRSRSIDAYLILVGRGEEQDNLQKLALDLGIPREKILFTGFRDDIQNILNAMDLYVQPSLSEGHPIAVLEAMSLGVPVIASAVGGVPEIIGRDTFGTLVAPACWEDIYQCFHDYLICRDTFLTKASAAKKYIREAFSVEKMAGDYIDVYRKAMADYGSVH